MKQVLVYLSQPTPVKLECRKITVLPVGKHFIDYVQAKILETAGFAKLLDESEWKMQSEH